MRKLLLTILTIGSLWDATKCEILETIAQWPLLDFAFPYDQSFLKAFRPENSVPTGIEIAWHRIFVATPRLRAGVPATLSFFPRDIQPGTSPKLQAYPSWEWHGSGKGDFNCSGLISVYRIRLDSCNRLWVLDSGINTSIDDFRMVCPPKLLVFDLRTDQLVRLIQFPRNVLRLNSLLTNLVIDETTALTCDDVFVYISDTTGPGLLVVDGSTERVWKFLHASMLPDPNFATYQIGQDTFELFDGIVGLAFSPRLRQLYYQPLATDRLYKVPTSSLRAGPPTFGEQLPVDLVGRKSSQGLGLAVNYQDDTIIFSPLTETAIASWNPRTNEQRIVVYSPEMLQFAAEVRWIERDNGNTWILSSRFQKFFLQNVNARDINIRIIRLLPEIQPHNPGLIRHYETYYPVNFNNNTLTN